MRVLVTGARGFIGGAVLGELAARGHEIVAIGRNSPQPRHANVQFIQLDLLNV